MGWSKLCNGWKGRYRITTEVYNVKKWLRDLAKILKSIQAIKNKVERMGHEVCKVRCTFRIYSLGQLPFSILATTVPYHNHTTYHTPSNRGIKCISTLLPNSLLPSTFQGPLPILPPPLLRPLDLLLNLLLPRLHTFLCLRPLLQNRIL